MTQPEQTEALLDRMSMGDSTALAELYDDSADRLYGIACHMLADQNKADDALLQALQRIWRQSGGYRLDGVSATVWLVSQTREVCAEILRQNRGAPSAGALATPGPDPEQNPCLLALPPRRAEQIRGAWFAGWTYDEMAADSASDPAELRAALRQSLVALRACLSDSAASEFDPDRAALAAEYVLGLLPEDQSRSVDEQIMTDAALEEEIADWAVYFAALALECPEIKAPPQILQLAEASLWPRSRPAIWRQVLPYLLGAIAAAGVAWLAAPLIQTTPAAPQQQGQTD